MNSIHTLFYLLLACTSFSFGMEEIQNISHMQRAIVTAPTVDAGAQIFNSVAAQGKIALTVNHTRWCIHTLADKRADKDIFASAQKLNPNLTREWLADFLVNPEHFEFAREQLQRAIENKDVPLATLLLSSKSAQLANSCTKGEFYRFAYHNIICGHNEILIKLIEAGSDITHLERDSTWAPIHIAALHGNYGAIQLFLDAGIHPDFPCKEGKTALFHICRHHTFTKNHLNSALLLLAHGANTDIVPHEHSADRNQIIQRLNTIMTAYNIRKKLS